MRTKAWSYIRLSTMDQIADGRDGELRQLDAAAAYAKAHDLALQPPLKDLGVSAFKGRNRKVGKLRLFFSMVEMGLVPPQSYFLVENCDRLSREEPLIALETFTAIINAGINVVTTDDQQVWNRDVLRREPMKLMMWIMGTIRGNQESARKSEMVTKAHRRRLTKMREEGKATSGRVPTWLMKLPGGGYDVDPIKGPVIERIFIEFEQGLGATRIAHRLNTDGVLSFNDYKRGTNGWHGSVVRHIGTNRAVIGEHQPTKQLGEGEDQQRVPDGDPIPNYYPAALKDEALFHRVQAIIRARKGVIMPKGE